MSKLELILNKRSSSQFKLNCSVDGVTDDKPGLNQKLIYN